MAIPVLPPFYDMPFVNKDGRLTNDALLYNDETFQSLNTLVLLFNDISLSTIQGQSFTVDGITMPSKTTAEIVALEPQAPNGTIWYNSSLKKLQFKADSGLIETITSS